MELISREELVKYLKTYYPQYAVIIGVLQTQVPTIESRPQEKYCSECAFWDYEKKRCSEWIPIEVRELNDEERERYGDEYGFMWVCPLPDYKEEVLITLTFTDRLAITTFYDNEFEDYDWEEIKAWASLPKPYKADIRGEE